MLEMGNVQVRCHRELGKTVVDRKADALYLFGAFADEVRSGALRAGLDSAAIVVGANHRDLGLAVRKGAKKGDWVLFKGSRGAAMEKALAAFKGEGA